MTKDALPTGSIDSFKAMGNTKWGDIELKALLPTLVPPLSR
jgi:hypothetical protein